MSIRDEAFAGKETHFDLPQAIAEANRCLLCYDPPCSRACPADTRPGEFIRKLRLKNITGAIRTIKENNILGGACGALCPTAELCERECAATGIGRPIAIGKIQETLVAHGQKTGFRPLEAPQNRADSKIAVLGSGPAGLACAAELAKAGYQVSLFEERAEPGGALRYGIMPYRMDPGLLQGEIEDLLSLGVDLQCNRRIQGETAAEDLLNEGFAALFLAPGLWRSKQLTRRGPGLTGWYSSIAYLQAIREGNIDELHNAFMNKRVAVIGGGDVAMECVQSALKLGPSDVYLIYRRSYAQMPGEEKERLAALQSGAHFLLLNQPVDFVTEQDRITGLKCVRTELGPRDDSGRRTPQSMTGSEWVLKVDSVIEAIGKQAETESTTWYPSVLTDQQNLIQVEEGSTRTSRPGIFAGGDIVRGPALVVTAVEDGKKAAGEIMAYLRQRS